MKKIWTISSQIIIDEAVREGYKFEIIDKDMNLFEIIFDNGKKKLFKNIDCGLNSSLALKLAEDKKLTYKLLENGDFIAKSEYFNLEEDKNIDINSLDLKLPLVVKPIDESHGNGVTTKIFIQELLDLGIKKAKKFSNNIVIQEFQKGVEIRVLVIDGKLVGAVNKEAAFIIGNGKNTIKELIIEENKNPLRGEELYIKPMSKIIIDTELKEFIKKGGYELKDILQEDKKLILKQISSIGTGGISIDVTDKISDDIKKLAIDGVKKLGLVIAGVDIISNDFKKNIGKDNSAIILEINSTPAIFLHHFPVIGKPRNIAKKILELAKNK